MIHSILFVPGGTQFVHQCPPPEPILRKMFHFPPHELLPSKSAILMHLQVCWGLPHVRLNPGMAQFTLFCLALNTSYTTIFCNINPVQGAQADMIINYVLEVPIGRSLTKLKSIVFRYRVTMQLNIATAGVINATDLLSLATNKLFTAICHLSCFSLTEILLLATESEDFVLKVELWLMNKKPCINNS